MMSVSVLSRMPGRAGLLGLVLISGSLLGCQSWWKRSGSQSLLGFANESQSQDSDDWEAPRAPNDRDMKTAPAYQSPPGALRNGFKVGNPSRVTLPRDRQKDTDGVSSQNTGHASETKTTAGLVPAAAAKTQEATPKTEAAAPKPVAQPVQPASAIAPAATNPEAVRDSGQTEVDVEGALSLLPAEYQGLLRKRISGETQSETTTENAPVTKSPLDRSVDVDPNDPNRWTHQLNQSVVALEKLLEASTELEPAVREHHEMTLRLLYLAQRNLEQAKRPISGATPHEQEYLEHQLIALYHATSPDPNPSRPRHWAQVAAEHRHADRHLAALSSLQVSTPVFCTQVDGYGVTQKFDKNSFAPDQQVLLYCELENVTSLRVREGFETKVKGSYEIRDAQGKRIVEQALPMEPDVCSSQRRDFFLVYMIYMPPAVEPGKYELILTMEDLCGNKFGTSKTEFEIKK